MLALQCPQCHSVMEISHRQQHQEMAICHCGCVFSPELHRARSQPKRQSDASGRVSFSAGVAKWLQTLRCERLPFVFGFPILLAGVCVLLRYSIVSCLVVLIFLALVCVGRSNDIGHSPYFGFWVLVPFLGLLAGWYLGVCPLNRKRRKAGLDWVGYVLVPVMGFAIGLVLMALSSGGSE